MNRNSTVYGSIEIEQHGNGRALVLLHSLLSDTRAFRPILPVLSANRRIFLPSLPGYGQSARSTEPVEGVARLVMKALSAAGAEDGFDLLGNGYGGFVALAMAQQFGDRIGKLILLDTAAAFPPAGKDGVRAMKTRVEEGGMAAVAPAAMQRLFPQAFAEKEPELVEIYRQALLGFDPGSFASTCQNLIDVDLRPGLSAIENPTLVVVGLEDAATPPPLAEELAVGIPGARHVKLSGLGHAPHVQAPEPVLKALTEFLKS
jgi:3-oxoadipate enol-lactonase